MKNLTHIIAVVSIAALLPILAHAHPCLALLQQSAYAGVAAKICQKQVNMESITALHQQNQCAAFFAQESIKSQINALATQASQKTAQEAQQLGGDAYCQKAATDLGSLLK